MEYRFAENFGTLSRTGFNFTGHLPARSKQQVPPSPPFSPRIQYYCHSHHSLPPCCLGKLLCKFEYSMSKKSGLIGHYITWAYEKRLHVVLLYHNLLRFCNEKRQQNLKLLIQSFFLSGVTVRISRNA